ncbi:MAG TPA: hypothetical protein VM532_00925 [Burkholderiales bacterium]|nr:hypothetical protein [Burkholderiales bacterium]
MANGFLQLISASRSNSRDAADFSDQSWWERKFPQMPQPLRDLAHSMQHFYKLHPETPVPSDAARARQDISTNLQSYKDRYLQQELSKQKADVLGGLLQKVKNELESLKQKEQKAIREQRRDALHQRLNAEAKQLNKGLQDDTVKQGGAVMELLKSVLETRQRIARERGEDEARIEAARQLKGSLAELNIKGADSKTLTAMMHRAFAENISLDSSGDTLDTLHARLKQKCDRELKRMNNGADAVADPLIQRSLEIAEAKDDTTRAILTARLVNDFPGWNQEAVAGLLINDVEWRESISEREPQLKTEAAKTTQALKTLEYDFDAVGASKTDAANCLETIKAIIRAAAEHGPEEEFPSSNWQDRLSRVPQEARDCVGAVRAACLSNFTDVPHTDISDFKSMSDIQDWAKWVNRENLKDAYLESTKEFLEDVQRTLPAGRDSLESSGFTKEAEEIEEAIATLAHTQAERQSVLSPPPSQKSGDEDSRPQTPGSKLPSYQKTLEELSPVERDAVRQEINGAYVLKDFISTSYSIFPMKKFQNAWLVNHAEGGKKSENAFLIPMNWISETDKRRFEAYSGDAPIRFSPSRQDKEKKVDTSITRNLGGRGR